MNKREKNAAYWAQRAKQSQDAILDMVQEQYASYAKEQYDEAIRAIEEKIRAWYQRLAKNNGVTFKEAKKLLSKDELKEFHWDVKQYMEKAFENTDGLWDKELENASAKVHITQLEALKTRLRRHCEEIADKQISTIQSAMETAYTDNYWHTAYEIQSQAKVITGMRGVDKKRLETVLRRPWTSDGSNFVARCWKDKNRLSQVLDRELTRMVATGEKPDRAIRTIAKEFGTSRENAGRLVMTESAHAASEAQAETFRELKVERYQIVATLSKTTCAFCGQMDGLVFPMSERKEGITAHPFHPNCRCTTKPYDEDVEKFVARVARDAKTGEKFEMPAGTTYADWKKMQDEKYGEGFVDTARKKAYNEKKDWEQYRTYQNALGMEAPQSFANFQKIKYEQPDAYEGLKKSFRNRFHVDSEKEAAVQKKKAEITADIRDGKYNLKINTGHQKKHIATKQSADDKKNHKSIFFGDQEKAQQMVQKYHGTGDVRLDSKGEWSSKEFVKVDEEVGAVYNSEKGEYMKTTRFAIHYGKNGTHIVPVDEEDNK